MRLPRLVAIVEDDPEQLSLAVEFFTDEGIPSLSYDRVPDLEVATRERTPDVVVLDACLRDSAGADTVRLAQDAWPSAPIVVWTAHTDPGLRVACLEAGCDDVVIKSDPNAGLHTLLRNVRDAHLRRQGWRQRVPDDAVAAAQQALKTAQSVAPAIQRLLGVSLTTSPRGS